MPRIAENLPKEAPFHTCFRTSFRKTQATGTQVVERYGRRGWTRTSDHLLRRQVLYPPELRALGRLSLILNNLQLPLHRIALRKMPNCLKTVSKPLSLACLSQYC